AMQVAELPLELPVQRIKDSSFVIVPPSYCRRFTVVLAQRLIVWADSSRQRILKGLGFVYERSPNLVKKAYRALKRSVTRWKSKRQPLAACMEIKSEAFRSLFPKGATLQRVATG